MRLRSRSTRIHGGHRRHPWTSWTHVARTWPWTHHRTWSHHPTSWTSSHIVLTRTWTSNHPRSRSHHPHIGSSHASHRSCGSTLVSSHGTSSNLILISHGHSVHTLTHHPRIVHVHPVHIARTAAHTHPSRIVVRILCHFGVSCRSESS